MGPKHALRTKHRDKPRQRKLFFFIDVSFLALRENIQQLAGILI